VSTMKDNAVSTDTNERQWNPFLMFVSIQVPFSPFLF